MAALARTHPKFSAEDADVLVLSSDNVLFRLHSANIHAHTTVFPTFLPSSEPAHFSEDSTILEILFAHLYPTRPNLEDLDVGVVQAVGYAAYKYGIASAMSIFDLKMIGCQATLPPTEVALHALRHYEFGSPQFERAMAHSLAIPLETAITLFEPKFFVAWLFYRDKLCNDMLTPSRIESAQNRAMALPAGSPMSYAKMVEYVAKMDFPLLAPHIEEGENANKGSS